MKKLTAISLFLFWALVTSLLTAGLVMKEKKIPIASNETSNSGTTLTMEKIAKHNAASDCWLLIDGKIYDVTSYIYQHPGDAKTIIPTCGTDATQAYATKGRDAKPKTHSAEATALLKNYYIGALNQVATSQSAPAQTSTPQPIPATATPLAQQNGTAITLSTAEIAAHNSTANCWMIVNGKVYNITGYIPRHPGGASAIAPYCGKDGSAAFEGLPHSTNAHQLLAAYLVGSVGQTTTVQPTQPTPIQTVPTGKGSDDDWDDD